MARKHPVSLGTINTILNTAPIIIQGATRLVRLIKDRNKLEDDNETMPDTLEGMGKEIERINHRIDAGNESDLEQIKLIEELARQNELLASSLKKTGKQLVLIAVVLCLTLAMVIFMALQILIFQHP